MAAAPQPHLRAVSSNPHDRIPPSNVEAEAALIGSIMVDATMLDVAAEYVRGTDFHAPLHGLIFETMISIADARKPIDKISLAEELRRRGELDKIGGMAYLSSLMDTVPTSASAEYYARLVREKAVARALIAAGSEITTLGYDAEGDLPVALASAERVLAAATERGAAPTRLPEQGSMLRAIVTRLCEGEKQRTIAPPYRKLHALTGGFTGGELVAIVAAAKMGKSGFALCMAEYIAETVGPFAFFATEMGAEATERRRIALRSGVSARKQRTGDLTSSDVDLVIAASDVLRENPLFVLGREYRAIRAFWRACRELRNAQGPLAGICVDHVGFVEEARLFDKTRTETQALDDVYRSLLDIAGDFDCPLFVVVHPNREGAIERPSRATLHKIRGGGALENHAHTILCPWRKDPINNPTEAELIVVATRDGGDGPIPFDYDGARAAWREVDHGHKMPLWFERGAAQALPMEQQFHSPYASGERPIEDAEVEQLLDPQRFAARQVTHDDLAGINELFGEP
jgi:replicative DNA helicase